MPLDLCQIPPKGSNIFLPDVFFFFYYINLLSEVFVKVNTKIGMACVGARGQGFTTTPTHQTKVGGQLMILHPLSIYTPSTELKSH